MLFPSSFFLFPTIAFSNSVLLSSWARAASFFFVIFSFLPFPIRPVSASDALAIDVLCKQQSSLNFWPSAPFQRSQRALRWGRHPHKARLALLLQQHCSYRFCFPFFFFLLSLSLRLGGHFVYLGRTTRLTLAEETKTKNPPRSPERAKTKTGKKSSFPMWYQPRGRPSAKKNPC